MMNSTNQMQTGNRSPRTRRRTVAALVAGVTLSASLAAAGALGLTGHASAATTLSGTTYVDVNRDGQITVDTVNPWLNDKRLAGITISVFDTTGTKIATTQSGADGNWQLVVQQAGPFRVEFASSVPNVYPGFTTGGGDVQFTNGGLVNYGLYAKLNGLGEVEDLLGKVDFVQIGNRVWLDTNANGIQDPGEAGINGVTVEMAYPNGTPVVYENGAPRVTTTEGDGNYNFDGLPQNTNYLVLIKDSAQNSAILANYGLTVQSARTGNGSNQNDSDAVLVGTSAQIAALTPRFGADLDFDFGYKPAPPVTTTTTTTVVPTYCLGDLLFEDLNGDGSRQAGELGVAGQTVTVFNATGAPSGTATTDANGAYKVCGLPAGTYTAQFTKPAGTSFTVQLVGNDMNNANANGLTPPVTITNADILTVDAGVVKPVVSSTTTTTTTTTTTPPGVAALGDRVFYDDNRDGRDTNEPGVPGVTVKLFRDGVAAGIPDQTTNANGNYLFTNLVPGTYSVTFSTTPLGTTFTTKNAPGSTAENDSNANANGTTDPVTLAAGSQNLTVDAGVLRPEVTTTTTTTSTTTTTIAARTYCLGDLMFDDLNGDGIRQSNEPGVVGETAFAFNSAGAKVGQAQTDANGGYTICGLAPGVYTVSFTKPANSSFTKQLEGNDRNNANSAGVLPAVTITNANILSADAGIVRNINATYCLGDFVWIDQNLNGMQDFLEPGVSGVPVTVLNSNGAVVGTATTDASGAYKVCGLAPGSYTVRFTAPSGLLFTTQYADSDRAKDSDANSTGITGTIVIVNADVLTVDAGLYVPSVVIVVTTTSTTSVPVTTIAPPITTTTTTPPVPTGCLGDKVFIDASGHDNDGRGIPGVTITLVKPDGTTSTALTDANGNYTFCSLTGGRYTVRVNPATLPKGSLPSYDLNRTKNNETTVGLPTGQSNRDVDFGYVAPIVHVEPGVVEQPAGDIPAFTGLNTTTQILWGLSFLLMGFGIVGLAVDRRRYNH